MSGSPRPEANNTIARRSSGFPRDLLAAAAQVQAVEQQPAMATVLHLPHASNLFPKDIRQSTLVNDQQRRAERIRVTDWHTDRLLQLPSDLAVTVALGFSRLVVAPPRRFAHAVQEQLERVGQDVVYTATLQGQPVRTPLEEDENKALIDRYY